MQKNHRIYSDTFTIRSYEVRPEGTAKLMTICNLLQEVAGNHARQLDYDINQLRENNRTWFLYRLQLEMQYYPVWKELVTIETWPSGGKGVLAHRDFLLYNEQNEVLGRATTQWMIVDLNRERPVPIPQEVFDMEISDRSHVITPKRGKIALDPENGQNDKKDFHVRRSDLDINGHVNNVTHINWISESVPRQIYSQYQLSDIDIIYQGESKLGDMVRSSVYTSSNSQTFRHRISRHHADNVLATARTTWNLPIEKDDSQRT